MISSLHYTEHAVNARKTHRHYTCSREVVDRHGSTLLSHVTNLKSACISLELDHRIALEVNLVNSDATALVA